MTRNIIEQLQDLYYKDSLTDTNVFKFIFKQNDTFFDVFNSTPVFSIFRLLNISTYIDDTDTFFLNGKPVKTINGLLPWNALAFKNMKYTVAYTNGYDTFSYPLIEPTSPLKTQFTFTSNTICYYRLDNFTDFDIHFLSQNQGKTLVLDLRNNKGGSIRSMLDFLKLFDTGSHFYLVNKGISHLVATPINENPFFFKCLFILVGKNTASSAEFFVQSLREKNKCVILGQPTYGKWVTHQLLPYRNFFIKIPTYEFETLHHLKPLKSGGLQPDFILPETQSIF